MAGLDFYNIPIVAPGLEDRYEDPTDEAFDVLGEILKKYGANQVHGEDLNLAREQARNMRQIFTELLGYYQGKPDQAAQLGVNVLGLEQAYERFCVVAAVFTADMDLEGNPATGESINIVLLAARSLYFEMGEDPHATLARVYPETPAFLKKESEDKKAILYRQASKLNQVHSYFFTAYAIKGNSRKDLVSDLLADEMHNIIPGLLEYLTAIESNLAELESDESLKENVRRHIGYLRDYASKFEADYQAKIYRDQIVENSNISPLTNYFYHTAQAMYKYVKLLEDRFANK
jgi:hypothetical protein